METIKGKIISRVNVIYNTLIKVNKKDSVSEDVKSIRFVVFNGKTTEESIKIKKMFDVVFEKELSKRLQDANNELSIINNHINK
jgi:hypothetical protein